MTTQLTTQVHDLALELAERARREAVIQALVKSTSLTLERLDYLTRKGRYAEYLRYITFREVLAARDRTHAVFEVDPNRPLQDSMLRVFQLFPDRAFTSGFFQRYMNLERWIAQKRLAEMADQGLLDRSGTTSGTKYKLASPPG
jgi:hypothetical protein